MRTAHLSWLLAGALLAGCPSSDNDCAPAVVSSDVTCTTSQDCIDEGFNTLACINGTCLRACARDSDCVLERGSAEDECTTMIEPQAETPFCEAQICRTGCPSVACGASETCEAGRCVYDFEGFEIPEGSTFIDLPSIGFVAEDVELTNRTVRVAQIGRFGCALGDEMCAGVASTGDRFVVLGTQPTRQRGTADGTHETCRDCACCLDCLTNPPRAGENAMIPICPGVPGRLWSVPQSLICPATPPAECQAVCTACDQCPAANAALGEITGERLTPCETQAASRGCANCQTCNASIDGCRSAMCDGECAMITSVECQNCVRARCFTSAECINCDVCRQAAACASNMTGTAECRQFRADCDALGAGGCFATPNDYPRAGLSASEQSLTSRPIDLSGSNGNVVVEMDLVAFNVGIMHKVGIEGTDPMSWPNEAQEVVVELCGGNCGTPASWVEGMTPDAERAFFPPLARRNNGLSLGSQSEIDWRNGLVRVVVPEALRTSTFRYRIRPNISEGARVGVDDIYVRTIQ